MHRKDGLANWARGRVMGYFVNRTTGERTRPFDIHNIITYTAADIMAKLVGGDTSYIPGYIGFIYGTTATPGLVDPITSRSQTWTDLATELAPVNKANVLISPLATSPSYAEDTPSGLTAGIYSGNAVTIAAHTGSRLEYGFTAGTYANPLADSDYIYHCMLITRLTSGSTITYLPYARVSLLDSTYPQKPVGMELAIFWTITFN